MRKIILACLIGVGCLLSAGPVQAQAAKNPYQKYLDDIVKYEERIRKEFDGERKNRYRKYLHNNKLKLEEALEKRIGKPQKQIKAIEAQMDKLDLSKDRDNKKYERYQVQLEKLNAYVQEQTEFAYPEMKKARLAEEAKAKPAEPVVEPPAEKPVAEKKSKTPKSPEVPKVDDAVEIRDIDAKPAAPKEPEYLLTSFATGAGDWATGKTSAATVSHSNAHEALIMDQTKDGVGFALLNSAPIKDIARIKVYLMVDEIDGDGKFGLAIQSSQTNWDDCGWIKFDSPTGYQEVEFEVDPAKHPSDIKWARLFLRTHAAKAFTVRIQDIRYTLRPNVKE